MKIIRKLKSEKGGITILVILMMVLVGITILILSKQVIRQIKTTKSTQDDIIRDYELEGAMNSVIGEFMSNIDVEAVSGGIQQTEKPSYIADDAVTHRLGRYILTLVEEIGIINGTLTHADRNESMDASISNNSFLLNKDLDISIRNILGENKYDFLSREYNIKNYNAITKYLFNNNQNVGIENEKNLKKANLCLASVKNYLDDMSRDLDSINNNLLTNSQKEYIKNNLKIANEIYNYLYYITNKYNESSKYYDYEYFLSANDIKASNLNQVVKNMTEGYDNNKIIAKSDLDTLSMLLNQSEYYLNQIPKVVSTINIDGKNQKYTQTQISEDLESLSNNISNTKKQFIYSIRKDLENADKTIDEVQKLNYIIDASIKLNKLIVMIGKVNADSTLHFTISKTLTSDGQITSDLQVNEISDSEKLKLSKSLARITVQNARRTLKATSLLCDYMEYKLSKSVLNNYPNSKILKNPLDNLKDIKINTSQNGLGLDIIEIYQNIKDITNNIYGNKESLYNDLYHFQNIRFNNNSNFIQSYDNSVKQMVSLSKNSESKYKIPYIIVGLEEQYYKLSKLNDKYYDEKNYETERKLKNVIQYLKSVNLILDNLVIDNTAEKISFNGENTVNVTFSEAMIKTLSEYNNGKSEDKVYIDIGKIKVKMILNSSGVEDSKPYEVSSSEKISLNPSRSLEFIIPIKIYKEKNFIKSIAYVKLYNIKTLSDKKVKYDLNYKISDLDIS